MKHRPAFTLVEVLVAVALLLLLAGAVSSFLWQLLDRESRVLDWTARSRTASVMFDRLQRDLFTAVASTPDGPGVVGDPTGMVIAHRAFLVDDPDLSDLQRTEIRFDPRAGTLRLTRRDWARPPIGGENEAHPDEPVPADDTPPADGIRAVRFRYHDGRAWRSSFSSTRSLPAAVEVAVWFGGISDGDIRAADEPPAAQEMMAGDRGADDPSTASLIDTLGQPRGRPPQREPDRLRVIAIPDATAAGPRPDPDAVDAAGGGS